MRIAIAARGLGLRSGGVKEYIRNIINALILIDKTNEYFVYYSHSSQMHNFNLSNVNEVVLRSSLNVIWDHVLLPRQLLQDRINVTLHPKCVIPILCPGKSVVVIHDLAYFLPDLKAYRTLDTAYMKLFIPFSCRYSSAVIADSMHTKTDVAQFIKNVPSEKITVVPLAPAWPSVEIDLDIRTKHGLGNAPYIFFSASLSARKNIERLILALEKIKDQIRHNIVITGGKSWGNSQIDKILDRSGLSERFIKLGHVDNDDLPHLYRNADLYVMPSLYEGFSLTLLEAMQEGCPVVASNVSSHPEVAGDAAVMFDPYSIDDMASAILRVATDAELKEKLREAGFKQVQKFSWERCAKETLAVIESVGAPNT